MDDTNKIIGELFFKTFNIRIRRIVMFESENQQKLIPALYFGLNEDENTEKHNQIIKEAVESFEGTLKWRFGRAYPSRINYEIIPKIVRDKMDQYYEKTTEYVGYRNLVSEEEYKLTIEKAIVDIPSLYIHLEKYFKEHIQ